MSAARDDVRRSVAERRPIDRDERVSIDRFLAEFDRLVDPLDQSLDPVHVTGSAIVIGPAASCCCATNGSGSGCSPVVMSTRANRPGRQLCREAHEETGLDVVYADIGDHGVPPLVHVDVHPGGRGHTHLDLRYVLDGGDADPAPPPGESQEVAWFGWGDAVERAGDDRLKALLRSLATG